MGQSESHSPGGMKRVQQSPRGMGSGDRPSGGPPGGAAGQSGVSDMVQ